MFYCKKIQIEHLEEIQQSVLKLIPRGILQMETLLYLKNNRTLFLSIEPLRAALEKLDFLKDINQAGIGLNLVNPKAETAIHIDTGSFPYSFNIPITHCRDSFVNFYKLKNNQDTSDLKIRNTPFSAYIRAEKDECDLVESFELSTPFIMNTKTLHGVSNFSNDKRITLLIRLNETVLLPAE